MYIRLLSIYGEELVQLIVYIIVGTLGIVAKQLLTRFVNTETKRTLAKDTVAFVAQCFQDLDGPAKMKKAEDNFLQLLRGYGIDITPTEMRVFLEAAYNKFKQEQPVFGPSFCVPDFTYTAPEAETDAEQA